MYMSCWRWSAIRQPTQQVVVDEMLLRLVRAFGKALKRRLPALHGHLCKEVRKLTHPLRTASATNYSHTRVRAHKNGLATM